MSPPVHSLSGASCTNYTHHKADNRVGVAFDLLCSMRRSHALTIIIVADSCYTHMHIRGVVKSSKCNGVCNSI